MGEMLRDLLLVIGTILGMVGLPLVVVALLVRQTAPARAAFRACTSVAELDAVIDHQKRGLRWVLVVLEFIVLRDQLDLSLESDRGRALRVSGLTAKSLTLGRPWVFATLATVYLLASVETVWLGLDATGGLRYLLFATAAVILLALGSVARGPFGREGAVARLVHEAVDANLPERRLILEQAAEMARRIRSMSRA